MRAYLSATIKAKPDQNLQKRHPKQKSYRKQGKSKKQLENWGVEVKAQLEKKLGRICWRGKNMSINKVKQTEERMEECEERYLAYLKKQANKACYYN